MTLKICILFKKDDLRGKHEPAGKLSQAVSTSVRLEDDG